MREFQLEVKFHSAAYWSVSLTFLCLLLTPVSSPCTYINKLSHASQVISIVNTLFA